MDQEFFDNTTYKRYPTLRDLLRLGGEPGLEYLCATGANIRKFERYGWVTVTQRIRGGDTRSLTFSIEGPRGIADTVVLMRRGTPIYGAAQGNGIRPCTYDAELEDITGLRLGPDSPAIPLQRVSEAERAAASNKLTSKEATRAAQA